MVAMLQKGLLDIAGSCPIGFQSFAGPAKYCRVFRLIRDHFPDRAIGYS
jgi:hypothetical protein